MSRLKAQIDRLGDLIVGADAIVVGAGAGLSSAAGHDYTGERFRSTFADFEEKYGFHDCYSGGFHPYETLEEFWAFWSRNIMLNRYSGATDLYKQLHDLLAGRNFFVITTNVDHQFQLAGFPKDRLYYTQGDYGLLQCSKPCCQKTYDNEDLMRQMVALQRDMRVPSELVPQCPRCGAPMTTNLRCDDTFVQDEGWYAAAARYRRFLESCKGKRTLFLELGVGFNTPGIIKYSFMQMTYQNPHATYAVVNKREAIAVKEIASRALLIDADIARVVGQLLRKDER